jgi:hypothetical protein
VLELRNTQFTRCILFTGCDCDGNKGREEKARGERVRYRRLHDMIWKFCGRQFEDAQRGLSVYVYVYVSFLLARARA